MKTLNKTLIALVTGAVLTTGANAAVNYNNDMMGQAYVGVKAGQIDTETKGIDADKATAYGVYGGYEFGQGFGVELDYVTSSDTDYKTSTGMKGEYKASTLGGYGTYKYTFPNSNIYAKGKLGFAQTKAEINNKEYDDTGIAAGIGLGMDISQNLAIEGEYTRLPTIEKNEMMQDTDANLLTIGAKLKF